VKRLLGRVYTALILGVVALLCAVLPAALFAQDSAGSSIAGTVTDIHGRVVQNASVTVKNNTTGADQKTATDDQGHYRVLNLPDGTYSLNVQAPGFAAMTQDNIQLTQGQPQTIAVQLKLGSLSQNVEVEAIAGNSIAGQHALSQSSLDTQTPKSEISSVFIREFTPPQTDFSEIVQIAPGAFTYNSNGVGLGQGTIYFRGFPDGDYDITWDGIPFNDTNNPTHHSWVFFPGLWIGGVDFDRSPGLASTIGPATFGGSINLSSPEVPAEQSIQPQVSYGSFNTLLLDGQYNTGMLGPHKNVGLTLDVHRTTTDGFQTLNYMEQNAGDLKLLYKLSDRTTITGYSGVIHTFGNAPNNPPYRAQVDTYGWNYLMQNNDPTSAFYKAYNLNTIPTDFEYVGIRSERSHGWFVDVKPYTYSYYNAQYYPNDNPNDETGLATGPNGSSGWITPENCSVPAPGTDKLPCAIDKLNSYRKYGETSTVSQNSKYGIFRAGLWYEWATSTRYQIPSDPLNHLDQALPNFREQYNTSSYNPFVEYEWHATPKLTITAGDKYAYYTMGFTQYADDGAVVGNLNGAPYIKSSGGFGSNLPSASANYRLMSNWSVYGQYGRGDEIPPTSIFDVTGGGTEVNKLPSPMLTTTYQGGSVLKLNRLTLDADYFHVKFQNNYIAYTVANPSNPLYNLNEYYLGPDSVTQGFEAETNAYLGYGINAYLNGTVGKGNYVGAGVPSGLNVADTPSYTQGLGLTYQAHGIDAGLVEKRIGDHYNDNGSYHNQVYVPGFTNLNLFLNYTIRKNSFFDQSKIGIAINNLTNKQAITDVIPFNSAAPINGSAYLATTAISPLDQLSQTAGRSIMVTFKMGLFPHNRGE
jgi:iron complex outermembrane recepter protein